MKIQALGFGAAVAVSCLAWGAASAQPQQQPLPSQDQLAAQASQTPGALDPAMRELAKRPTPKMPDGRPNMSGLWFGYSGGLPIEFEVTKSNGSVLSDISKPSLGALGAAFRPTANPPQYNPDYQVKLKAIQSGNMNRLDKVFLCGHPGLPRVGAPEQIIQTADQVVFLNADISGMVYRVVPIGGAHRDTDPSYYGVGVAHWEGDTLVVDTRNFSTDTWLGEEGFLHSDQLRVVERFRRIGDTIEYNVTAEDPGALTKPWVKPTRLLKKTDQPLEEPYPCDFNNKQGLDDVRHDQRAK